MKRSRKQGFDYYLSREALEGFREKPLELRLQWLYMGNLLRKGYGRKLIQVQDRFREGA